MKNRGIVRGRVFFGFLILFAAVIAWFIGLTMSPHGTAATDGTEHVRTVVAAFLVRSAIGTLILCVLAGWLLLPDPQFNAYRKDLADVALIGRVIASHYAEPLRRKTVGKAIFRTAPSDDAEAIRGLSAGEPFALLDDSLGWSWGYAGKDGRVGYVRSEAVG